MSWIVRSGDSLGTVDADPPLQSSLDSGKFDLSARYVTLSRHVLGWVATVAILGGLILVISAVTLSREGTSLSSLPALLAFTCGGLATAAFCGYLAWDSFSGRPLTLEINASGLILTTAARREFVTKWKDTRSRLEIAEKWYPIGSPESRGQDCRLFSSEFPFSPVVAPIEVLTHAIALARNQGVVIETAELVVHSRFPRHDWVTKFLPPATVR